MLNSKFSGAFLKIRVSFFWGIGGNLAEDFLAFGACFRFIFSRDETFLALSLGECVHLVF
jgi:hypothetical protein